MEIGLFHVTKSGKYKIKNHNKNSAEPPFGYYDVNQSGPDCYNIDLYKMATKEDIHDIGAHNYQSENAAAKVAEMLETLKSHGNARILTQKS